jgi:hypothetical protein
VHNFRIFLSYARFDRSQVEVVSAQLRERKFIPLWDENISPGKAFTDEIKRGIARAHLFMPLLTPTSCIRPWVHQEIGYALGIGVPVLPVAIGALPEGLLWEVQAITVQENLSDFGAKVDRADIETIVRANFGGEELERLGITTHVAEYGEDRTNLLIKSVTGIPTPARIRQRAIFSSFSLPDARPEDEIWDAIELPEPRGQYLRTKLREERQSMGRHASDAGCSLILYPFVNYEPVGAKVHRNQIRLLCSFLRSMPRDQVVVATKQGIFPGSVTIVGDWFGARALPPRDGSEYRQTIFCYHAPKVLGWLHDFDVELEGTLKKQGIRPSDSRDHALKRLEERLEELPEE